MTIIVSGPVIIKFIKAKYMHVRGGEGGGGGGGGGLAIG